MAKYKLKDINNPTMYIAGLAAIDSEYAKKIIKRFSNKCKAKELNLGIDVDFIMKSALWGESNFKKMDLVITIVLIPYFSLFIPRLFYFRENYYIDISAAAIFFMAVVFIVIFYRNRARKYVIKSILVKTDIPNTHDVKDNHNVVVYSGGDPFVGYGNHIGGWILTVDTDKRIDGRELVRFSAKDLEDHLISSSHLHGADRDAPRRVLFVDGKSLKAAKVILPDYAESPKYCVDESVIDSFVDINGRFRAYCQIRINEWDDELITSILFRCYSNGSDMVVSSEYFSINGIVDGYEKIDEICSNHATRNYNDDPFVDIFTAFFYVFVSPLSVLSSIIEPISEAILIALGKDEESLTMKYAANDPNYDYGVKSTLREVSSAGMRNYFQLSDRTARTKLVENKLLWSLMEFLEEKGVDVSDLKERQTTILNNGVLISGGNVTSGGIVAGQNSSSTVIHAPNGVVSGG